MLENNPRSISARKNDIGLSTNSYNLTNYLTI